MQEPSRAAEIAKYTLAAAVLVAVVVGAVVYLNRGSNVRLEGKILKVRAIATGEAASLALVDFRILNPAEVRFVVREVRVSLTRADGTSIDGLVAAESDLDRVLGYFPAYGPRYNDVLKPRAQMGGGQKADWCVGAGFDFSAQDLEGRKGLKLVIEDVDGAVVEISETRP
jgi:hypothetical protein